MFKVSHAVRAALVAVPATLAVLVAASPAAAVELQGKWAPFNRCPVDDPQMLAVVGGGNGCLSSVSPHGTFKIGSTTVVTGRTELQVGGTGPGIRDVIPPGYLAAEPVRVPGGLLGLACPSDIPLVSALCDQLVDNPLNRVTASVELAGAPSDFDLFAPAQGGPVITLPVKLHLENPVLGDGCYIGSEADPIVLHPQQTPLATGITFTPDPLGSNADFIETTPSPVTLSDDSFSVPRANGCGLLGLLGSAVDSKLGLPSPAGANSLVQEEAVASVVGNAPSGRELSDAWHAAVISP